MTSKLPFSMAADEDDSWVQQVPRWLIPEEHKIDRGDFPNGLQGEFFRVKDRTKGELRQFIQGTFSSQINTLDYRNLFMTRERYPRNRHHVWTRLDVLAETYWMDGPNLLEAVLDDQVEVPLEWIVEREYPVLDIIQRVSDENVHGMFEKIKHENEPHIRTAFRDDRVDLIKLLVKIPGLFEIMAAFPDRGGPLDLRHPSHRNGPEDTDAMPWLLRIDEQYDAPNISRFLKEFYSQHTKGAASKK